MQPSVAPSKQSAQKHVVGVKRKGCVEGDRASISSASPVSLSSVLASPLQPTSPLLPASGAGPSALPPAVPAPLNLSLTRQAVQQHETEYYRGTSVPKNAQWWFHPCRVCHQWTSNSIQMSPNTSGVPCCRGCENQLLVLEYKARSKHNRASSRAQKDVTGQEQS